MPARQLHYGGFDTPGDGDLGELYDYFKGPLSIRDDDDGVVMLMGFPVATHSRGRARPK